MDNEEVASYVIAMHFRACRSVQLYNLVRTNVNPSNSIVSHLLCEEARVRWFALCECNETEIQDISSLIVEIQSIQLPTAVLA
jgi:hypothetical protein